MGSDVVVVWKAVYAPRTGAWSVGLVTFWEVTVG